MNLIDTVNASYINARVQADPSFRTGDTVSVHVRVTEGAKSRIQLFQGICIAMKERNSINGHFRVRKISEGYGVERVFPFHSPAVEKIEVISRGKSRRAKHFYLRDRVGKASRIATDYSRKA